MPAASQMFHFGVACQQQVDRAKTTKEAGRESIRTMEFPEPKDSKTFPIAAESSKF
jgi:hypothetical protein